MRNSHNITLTNNDSLTEVEDTTWSLPGAVVGFLSWLCALAIPMLIYGSNTLLFFTYPLNSHFQCNFFFFITALMLLR